jgi:O-antigen biosynthesis protein
MDQIKLNNTIQEKENSGFHDPSLREKLASKYLRGEGIEIGALHQPLVTPVNVRVDYVDRLSSTELRSHYPELDAYSIKKPDIIDDAQTLTTVMNAQYDFCIANHVLEHMDDPIGALSNWIRILKPGGILFFSVPDINNPLDSGRNLTNLNHLIKDHAEKDKKDDFVHYLECARHWNNTTDENEIQQIASENYKKGYSIHYHTFNRELIESILSYILSTNSHLFDIREFVENNDEYIFILEKNTYVQECLKILENKKTEYSPSLPILDVIVPVENGYSELIRCLYSLLKYQTIYRIILINDSSNDLNIREFFNLLKPFESDQFHLLENDINFGFIKTANRGMRYSKQDTILLNGDTIVSKGWAEKLNTCAYSNDKIGTVTPFSNNGAIGSISVLGKNNSIPDGFTIDSYANLIENLSFKQYYVIPIAFGFRFCILIKRDLIEKIGFFEDDSFGNDNDVIKNDFFMRTIHSGYQNVLCDDTFIYHLGEPTSSDIRLDISNQNEHILAEKFPEYRKLLADFYQKCPLKDFQNYINKRTNTWDVSGRKKRILYILHHYGGGSEKHVLDLIHVLSPKYVCYIVEVRDNRVQLTEYNNNSRCMFEFPISEPIELNLASNDGYRSIMRNILLSFHIDLIHVQHLIGHSLDIFTLSEEFNIPLIFTAHDFYSICPKINLLDDTYLYCHPSNRPANHLKCADCLNKTMKVQAEFIKEWRIKFQQALNRTDLVIAPSRSVINILGDYYPNILDKCQVIEHGHEKELFIKSKSDPTSSVHLIFHIAYFGVLIPLKGRKIFYSLAKSPEFANKIKWSIFGTSDVHPSPGYYPDANITVYGSYNGYRDLQQNVKNDPVDLVIFPSICPETFSFTLSEAWALGIPVLVSDLGALKERVEQTGGGWYVDINNMKMMKDKILDILKNHDDYLKKKDEVSKIHLKSSGKSEVEYSAIYSLILNKRQTVNFYETGYSNRILFESMELKTNNRINREQQSLSLNIAPQSDQTLFNRFSLCYKENGFIYTLKRCFIFIFGKKF